MESTKAALGKGLTKDYYLACCIEVSDLKIKTSGSNKQNLSSLIFQAEPMPRINEFTYKS
jgi:hypothetical protein